MFRLFNNFFGKKKGDSTQDSPIDNDMKYLIAGLGNKGAEYNDTRHNIGFDIVDYLADKYDVSLDNLRYGAVGRFKTKGRTFVLLKPNTYMNLSGKSINFWLQKEKIKQQNLLVVSDDLNLDFGKVRLKPKGSAGGHNGLKNIEQILNSSEYARVRVGIGSGYSKGKQIDFVLGKWTKKEYEILTEITKHAAAAVISFGTVGLAHTMNSFNKTIKKPK